MHRSQIMLIFVLIFLFLFGITSVSANAQITSGILWQYFSLDDQGDWHLDNGGLTFTQTRESLLSKIGDLVHQPALLVLHGRIPDGGITLQVEANPTIGAAWDLGNSMGDVSLKVIDFQPYTNLSGSSGKMTVLINSTDSEVKDVQLIYHRPWLPGEKPGRKLVISGSTLPQVLDLSYEKQFKTSMPAMDVPANTLVGKSSDKIQSPAVLPALFDWRDSGAVTPARDQLFCGSCYAHAAVAAMESALLINGVGFNHLTLDLSEQYLVSCPLVDSWNDGCKAGNSSINAYHQDRPGAMYNSPGAVLESDFPYSPLNDNYPSINLGCGLSPYRHPYQLSSWSYVYSGDNPNMWRPYDPNPAIFAQNRLLIKNAIYTHGPVGAGMSIGLSNFSNYGGGVWSETPGSDLADHDILIVGWNDTLGAWIIKNSYGEDWGPYSGFAYISYDSPVIGFGAYYVTVPPNTYYGNLNTKLFIPLAKKAAALPAGSWITILDDDFESGVFPGNGWSVGTSTYTWGTTTCTSNSGSLSLWAVGSGSPPLGCSDPYPAESNSTLTYGPIDLRDATSAFMKFELKMNTQPYGVWHQEWTPYPQGWYTYDGFIYGASTSPGFYDAYPGYVMGDTSGTWVTMQLDLGDLDGTGYPNTNLLGLNGVYVSFSFWSDTAETGFYPGGIFIDDVIIKKCTGGSCPLDW